MILHVHAYVALQVYQLVNCSVHSYIYPYIISTGPIQ